jgi:hypothetical protein
VTPDGVALHRILTRAERAALARVRRIDTLGNGEYRIERGKLSGHAFADNGFSMVADLTTGQDIDADTIAEADAMIGNA